MPISVDTRATLLLRIQDPRNAEAWREFLGIYEPFVAAIASRFGFQAADADELTQDVFLTVLEKQHLFKKSGTSSFRRWLATITRNAAISRIRRQRNFLQSPSVGGSDLFRALHEVADYREVNDPISTKYLEEERAILFEWAAQQVRARSDNTTWEAFWKSTIDGLTPENTASLLNLSVGQVYVARCRILKRLRETVEQYLDSSGAPS